MSKRPETGPMKFGGDHSGMFIRGDQAFHFAHHLARLLDRTKTSQETSVSWLVLNELLADLTASLDDTAPSCQRLRTFESCMMSVKTCGGCGQVVGPNGCESSGCTGRAP